MKIKVNNVTYHGLLQTGVDRPYVPVSHFSYEFSFGSVYQLADEDGATAWALSWLIAGEIEEQGGSFWIDDERDTAKKRRTMSWLVRYDEIKRFGFIRQSVARQVRQGMRRYRGDLTEHKYIDAFWLTPQRYNRYLHQLSSEAWRASCAIGLAHGKRIFCFPPLEYGFVSEYKDLWFRDMLTFMKSRNCLTILPVSQNIDMTGIVDEIIVLNTDKMPPDNPFGGVGG